MSLPLVSFLMPVHNGADTVLDAVASVLTQDLPDLELLIVDDRSTDETPPLLARLPDPRVRILTNDRNRGLSPSLNRGLDEARGTYVARIDADDLCLPHRARLQAAYLHDYPDVAVLGSAIETFHADGTPGGTVSYPSAPAAVEAALLFRNVLAHPAVMFRRDTLRRAGLRYDEAYRCAQDYGLWLACIGHGLQLANLPNPLLRYRLHPHQLSHTFADGMQEEGRIIREQLLRQLLPDVAPRQLALHDAVARDRLSLADLPDADAWLRHLYHWNERSGRFSRQALGSVLCGRWVRILSLARASDFQLPIAGHPLERFLHPAARAELGLPVPPALSETP